jgi:hypothetical protein
VSRCRSPSSPVNGIHAHDGITNGHEVPRHVLGVQMILKPVERSYGKVNLRLIRVIELTY